MSKTVLISCYGVYDLNYRNAMQIEGLQNYFKSSYEYLKNLGDNLKAIVFCGGYRNFSTSEAETSRNYFLSLGSDFENIPLLLETNSKSTLQHLALGYLTASEGFIGDELLIICDSFRVDRVRNLSKVLFTNLGLKIEVIGFERADDHSHSSLEYQSETALEQDLNKPELQIWQQLLQNIPKS